LRKIIIFADGQKEVFIGDEYVLDSKPAPFDGQPMLIVKNKISAVAIFYKWTYWRILTI